MTEKTFHNIELESWEQRANHYDEYFADVTTQAVKDVLESLGRLHGQRHLDIACGTGHLVAEASKRGAISEGSDFSQSMLDVARINYPGETFSLADATQLPYDDATFDCVTCSFGLLHMEDPQVAVNEVYRVLKPKGRFTFTLWYGADDGNEFKSIVKSAIKAHGNPSISLPDSWTQLQNPGIEECGNLVSSAGFINLVFKRLPIMYRATSAHSVIDFATKLSIRTQLLLDKHSNDERQRILDYIASEAKARKENDVISLNFPALLTTAQKPE